MKTRMSLALALVVILFMGMIGLIGTIDQPVQAAPNAVPTPVSVNYSSDAPMTLDFWRTATDDFADNATVNSDPLDVRGKEVMDLQYNLDIGDVTTVTLKLQFSNDQADWVDGITVATMTTDTVDLKQVELFGAYVRLNAVANDTGTATLKSIGLAK